MTIKTHKRKKSSRMHGRKMGTHGFGARDHHRLGGKEGGQGMTGSGKRADHRKTLITKLYGHSYFGKKGITSRKSEKDKRKRINIGFIQDNLESFGKKTSKGWEIDLSDTKILGNGEIKDKLIISCLESSKSAKEKIEKAGGKIKEKINKEENPDEKKSPKKNQDKEETNEKSSKKELSEKETKKSKESDKKESSNKKSGESKSKKPE